MTEYRIYDLEVSRFVQEYENPIDYDEEDFPPDEIETIDQP